MKDFSGMGGGNIGFLSGARLRPRFRPRYLRQNKNKVPHRRMLAPPVMPEIMPTWPLLMGLVGEVPEAESDSRLPSLLSVTFAAETLTSLFENKSPTR